MVIVGDSLLDIDIEGTADRLSPDAPVPVVDVQRSWQRPGGAGLAALIAAQTVHEVVLITAMAADDAGDALRDLLDPAVDIGRCACAGAPARPASRPQAFRWCGWTPVTVAPTVP